MACDKVIVEMATKEGDNNAEVKEDDYVETGLLEGAGSPLVEEAGPYGSNEAETLRSVLRGMFEDKLLKETDTKNFKESMKTEKNRSQRRKTRKKNEEKGCTNLMG